MKTLLESVKFQRSECKSKSDSNSNSKSLKSDSDPAYVEIKIHETPVDSAALNKPPQNVEKQESLKRARKMKCGKMVVAWGCFAILFVAVVTAWLFYLGLAFQKMKQEAAHREQEIEGRMRTPADHAWESFKVGFRRGLEGNHGNGAMLLEGNGKMSREQELVNQLSALKEKQALAMKTHKEEFQKKMSLLKSQMSNQTQMWNFSPIARPPSPTYVV